MLQVGEDGLRALGQRLDASYEALMAVTKRHFGHECDGWALSGVAGLDTPTMNRATVSSRPVADAADVVREAYAFFGDRGLPWSVVLPSHSDVGGWHAVLMANGFHFSSSLSVLARPPVELPEVEPLGVTVRPAKPEELGTFTDLLLEVFHMPRRFYPALRDMTAEWQAHGARPYFAEVDGVPVATATVAEVDGVAGVYNVGTRRVFRRRGISRQLMGQLFADAMDADVITLQVAPHSVAEAFYLRLGFEPVHSWRFYTPGPRMPSFMTKWKASPG